MKKYYDVDHDKLWTEDELRKEYNTLKENGELEDYYETFEYYLNACLDKNGSLVIINPKWEKGINFVKELTAKYGLLEGYRIAEEYLKVPEDGTVEEAQFRQGIRFAMWRADNL